MIKKIFAVLTVGFFALSCLAADTFAKDLKIGCIDMKKVFSEYKKTQVHESKLEDEGKVKTEERNKMVEGIRRLKDEMEILSEEGKEAKEEEMDKKIKELQGFDRGARDELLRDVRDAAGADLPGLRLCESARLSILRFVRQSACRRRSPRRASDRRDTRCHRASSGNRRACGADSGDPARSTRSASAYR